ncbi:MAG: TolC family protein [Puniceicoccaceae bacterium]
MSLIPRCRPPSALLLILALSEAALPGAPEPPEDPAEPMLPLREALAAALESNFGIRAESLNPEIAREDTTIAESGFDPRFSAGVSWREILSARAASVLDGADQPENKDLSADLSVSKRFSPGTEVSAGTDFNRRETNSSNALLNPDVGSEFGVEIRQPLFRNFGRSVNLAPVRSAEAGFEESRIEYERALAQLFDEVASAYWEVAAARRRLELRDSSIRLAETILRRTEEESSLGLATRTDVLQAKAELATRLESRLDARKRLSDTEDRLLFLLGRTPGEEAGEFLTAALSEPPAETDDMGTVLGRAMAFDPLRRARERQVDQRFYDLVGARDAARPDLDLVLSGDYLGRDDELGESYRRAIDRDGYRWSAGVELSFPWGFAGEKARERQSVLRLRQAEILMEEAESLVRRDVREAWRQLESGRAKLDSAKATVELRVEVLESEEARRERGLSDISDVLEAARLLDDARLREVDAILETTLALSRLTRLDGTIFSRNGFDPGRLLGRSPDDPSDPDPSGDSSS